MENAIESQRVFGFLMFSSQAAVYEPKLTTSRTESLLQCSLLSESKSAYATYSTSPF